MITLYQKEYSVAIDYYLISKVINFNDSSRKSAPLKIFFWFLLY